MVAKQTTTSLTTTLKFKKLKSNSVLTNTAIKSVDADQNNHNNEENENTTSTATTAESTIHQLASAASSALMTPPPSHSTTNGSTSSSSSTSSHYSGGVMSSASRSTSPTIHSAPTSNGALGSSLKRLPLASSSSNTSASKQVGLPFFLYLICLMFL